jgi:multiple sugar transport system substrate-binding protein
MSHAHSRRLTAALGAVVLAATLGACSQGSTTDDTPDAEGDATSGATTTTIRYMNFSSNGGNEENLDKIVTAFEAANEGIDVEVETLPYADYFTALQTAVAGGTVADTFELNYENFVTYAENGSLAALPDIDTSVYQPSLADALNRDGEQYGVPTSFSNVVLFYNKDLFDAAGVATPTADWTWADEQAAAEQLTDPASGVWADYQPISYNEFYKALAQAGGTFFNDDTTEAMFDSPEGVTAANWLVGKSGTTMPTEADGAGTPDFDSNLFAEGKLAMWHTGIWMFGAMAEVPFDWDVVVEPGDTTKASAMFSNSAVVSADTDHLEAAELWVQFLGSSDTAVQTRLDASWELPPIADDAALASYTEQTPPANRQAVLDSLDAVVLPPVIERQQEMQDILTAELTSAAAGRKSVEDALGAAKELIDGLL